MRQKKRDVKTQAASKAVNYGPFARIIKKLPPEEQKLLTALLREHSPYMVYRILGLSVSPTA